MAKKKAARKKASAKSSTKKSTKPPEPPEPPEPSTVVVRLRESSPRDAEMDAMRAALMGWTPRGRLDGRDEFERRRSNQETSLHSSRFETYEAMADEWERKTGKDFPGIRNHAIRRVAALADIPLDTCKQLYLGEIYERAIDLLSDAPSPSRDEWMAQQKAAGKSLSEIRRDLRHHPEWDQITSNQGISQAIIRYLAR